MKHFLLLLFILVSILHHSAGAQAITPPNGNAPSWREHIALRTTAQAFQPFLIDKNAPDINADIKNATFLRLNPQELQRLLTERPRDLRFQIPTASGEPLTVELFESNPFAPNKGTWVQEADDIKKVSMARGLHYWGIVAGKVRSSVAFSFYENQVFGVLLTQDGNYDLGVYGTQANPSVNDLYILFNDRDAQKHPNFSCGTKELESPLKKQVEEQVMNNTATCKQVVIYFEADYALYQSMGSSVPNTVNLIQALFNEVAIIFANENISLAMGDIKVWTMISPYDALSTCIQYRDEFRDNQLPSNPFTWDLAHLLSSRSFPDYGGYAAGRLCQAERGYRSAVSTRIAPVIVPYPTYSYTIRLVCHELGHNFASPHTHSCFWTGGAIDGCVGVEGACAQPPPANPATIMSYCSNIDLSLGFGPLPGTRMRNHYQNATCVGSFSVESAIIAPTQEPAILCSDEGSIDLTANHCVGCTYQWFFNGVAIPNANDVVFNAVQAGNYSVAVRNRGCVAYSAHKNVVNVNAPCQQNGVLSNNQSDESCGTAPAGRLTLSGHTGLVLAWQMSNDNFVTQTTIPNTATTYDYPPLNETTCFRVLLAGIPAFSPTKCITVHSPPALTAAATRPVACPNNFISLESYCPTCLTYSWQPAENLLDPTVANPTVTNPVTATYTLTATDFNGCTQTATATVTIAEYDIDIERITADEVCSGDLVVYRRNGTLPNGFVGMWQQQFNCTGGWFMATTDRPYFTPLNLINGKTCYRYYFYNNATSCFYNTKTDTLDVCGTVRFTCTNTQYAANFNHNFFIPSDQVNNCQQGNPINWRNDVTVPGWYVASLGNGTFNHISQTGNCLLEGLSVFANESSTERSLGTWNGSSATNTAVGLKCKNETGGTIHTLNISYSGEQWYRHENTPIPDRLDFQYSIDATALDNGTWIDFDALDFISPQTVMTGAVNGNHPPYRTDFNNVIVNGLNIHAGQTFWLRWVDYDQNTLTQQDMLSVDDVSVSVAFTGSIPAPVNVSQPNAHCSGNTETYKVQSVPGSPPVTYTWSIPGGCAGWNLVSPNGTSSDEMRITAGTGNCPGITVTAQDPCGTSPAYNFNATVSACPHIAGTLGLNQTICSGETPNPLTLTGHTGNVLYWELSTDCPSFSETTLIPYTGTTLILPDYTTTTCFRVMVNTPDGVLPSQPATITVGQPVGNVFLDLQTGTFVCTGGCVKMNLTNHGAHTRWQKQEGCSGPFTDISGMDMPNMAYCGIVQKTCFRAVVSNPSCDEVFSAHQEINISNPLNPTTGVAIASNPTVCPGGCSNLTMTASNGTFFQWQEDPGCTNNFTDIRNGSMQNIQVCNITQTTCYRTRITKAECSPVVFSPVATVTVNPALTPRILMLLRLKLFRFLWAGY